MSTGSAVRGRGRWPRPLVLVTLLTLGTACGGSGNDARSAHVHRGAATDRTAEVPAEASPLGTRPSPDTVAALAGARGRNPAATPAAQAVPPPPELANHPTQAPPNTVSLETLHQQGRTHTLR